MNKSDFMVSIATGFLLGSASLPLLTLLKLEIKMMERNEQERQIKHDLILTVKNTCHPVYQIVHAAVYRDKITHNLIPKPPTKPFGTVCNIGDTINNNTRLKTMN